MRCHVVRAAMCLLTGALLVEAGIVQAKETAPPGSSHRTVNGVVMSEQSGLLTVKTEDGSQVSLAANASKRHGHAIPKVGQEVTLVMDENNQIIDAHLKGHEGKHEYVTGKLKYVGKMKKELKLETAQGDRTFPLERLEIKTGGIEEGTLVTAELNEAGTVIDLHRADNPATGAGR